MSEKSALPQEINSINLMQLANIRSTTDNEICSPEEHAPTGCMGISRIDPPMLPYTVYEYLRFPRFRLANQLSQFGVSFIPKSHIKHIVSKTSATSQVNVLR